MKLGDAKTLLFFILELLTSAGIILMICCLYIRNYEPIFSSFKVIDSNSNKLIIAQIGLNLPYYALNYIDCKNNKSEVTCQQVVHAWNVIHNWESEQTSLNRTINDTKVIHVSPRCGASNQMFHILAGGVLAIILNRSYFSENTLRDFKVPVPPMKMITKCTKSIKHHFLMEDHLWRRKSFNQMLHNNDSHYYITYTLHTRYFYIPGVSDFIFNNFGYHMVYFIGNYFIRLNQQIFEHVKHRFSLIPNHVVIWGIHLRFDRGHRAFIKNIDDCFDIVVPFLKSKIAKVPSVLFIASDDFIVTKRFLNVFNEIAHVLKPLHETDAGMNDFIMLMNCKKLLLTFRSTYSFLTAALTQRKAYWYNNEIPLIMKFSNSQIGIGNILREQYDYAKLVNSECSLLPNNEHLIRKYISNLIL